MDFYGVKMIWLDGARQLRECYREHDEERGLLRRARQIQR